MPSATARALRHVAASPTLFDDCVPVSMPISWRRKMDPWDAVRATNNFPRFVALSPPTVNGFRSHAGLNEMDGISRAGFYREGCQPSHRHGLVVRTAQEHEQ